MATAFDLHCSGEPLERLASGALVVAFHIVKCMGYHNGVHDKNNMVDCIEEFVWDTVAEVGRATNDKKSQQDDIPRNHDFFGELVTERLFAISAKSPKEIEKEDCSEKDDKHHGVAKVNMNPDGAVEGHEAVEYRLGHGCNGVPGHGERDKRHLEKNGMHR